MAEDRTVSDDIALPANRILSAWTGKLQEVVIVGIDSYGELVVASSASGVRATALLEKGAAEIELLSEDA